MTPSDIAKDTYRERLYDERCGNCEHCDFDAMMLLGWCPKTKHTVAEYGICKLWKKGNSDG